MVRKRSLDKAAGSSRSDDLKLIKGINSIFEKRLNGSGILTFAHLATKSPADIAAAVGLSSERIIKQDWIGKARRLAAESSASKAERDAEAAIEPAAAIEDAQAVTLSGEPEKDVEPSMEQYHSATYTVKFQLDEDNNVHSTHILHAESKREGAWTGWQKKLLVDFLNDSAGLKIQSDEPALLAVEEPDRAPEVAEEHVYVNEPDRAPAIVTESEPLIPLKAKLGLTGTLRGREMEVIGVKSGVPGRTLTQDEPFNVRLSLDLTDLQVPGNTPLNYQASLYGKNRSGPSGLVLGEAQGTMLPADAITIKIEGNTLPEGIYHLAAMVMLGLPGMKLAVRPGTTAVIDGGKIQVI